LAKGWGFYIDMCVGKTVARARRKTSRGEGKLVAGKRARLPSSIPMYFILWQCIVYLGRMEGGASMAVKMVLSYKLGRVSRACEPELDFDNINARWNASYGPDLTGLTG
jgi:hypothetical protein